MQVPLQRHLADGALFMCTNMLYLLAGLPPLLTPEAADALAPYRRTELDLFQGTEHCYPGAWVGCECGCRAIATPVCCCCNREEKAKPQRCMHARTV